MVALPSARAAAASGGGVTRSISSAEYALLIARNLGGVAPVVAPAPAARIAKHARTWQCTHCAYITTTRGLLQRHEADRHNIGVVWHACPECLPSGEPCLYKGKNMDDVREHLRKAHKVNWPQQELPALQATRQLEQDARRWPLTPLRPVSMMKRGDHCGSALYSRAARSCT